MKKAIKSIVTALMLTPAAALAEIPNPCPSNNPACGTGQPNDLITLITNISNVILLLVGVIAVLFLIIGGFYYMTSAGNPEQIGKAKTTILYAIIGILVTLLAWAVVTFVLGQFRPA